MDHFERELARMMRGSDEPAAFEPRHRERLRAGVRHRGRVRAARRAAGSVLAVAGLCLGLFLLPDKPSQVEPADHDPLPTLTTTPWTSSPPGTPSSSPSPSSSSATTGLPGRTDLAPVTTGPPTAPVTTGSASGATSSSTSNSTSPPPTGTATWNSEYPSVSTSLVTP
ncbi:hypothetical protein [Streptomyces griseorubiginosus]|uniref:hypothetical protein n=1 Tax=Streptomyces griseorubiginosus TaxID=67304 RepID=UPI002E800800|nr:hypothetical protein [Streptomyces griseorubiginosus]WUB49604.1 hypothetical protein OHN19_42225 [Streptomyces griseorubiginosus]WUB58133.1 hypothetical protein OG942_42235 [Streptomyces griseorubiginosus]